MNRAQRLIQAYANTPWRRDLQLIGLFSALVVVVALVATVYVWVSSQAGTYGRQVQEIQATSQATEQRIEDLRAELADITSQENMTARAEAAGYVEVDRSKVIYLVVPGYPGRETLQISPANPEDAADRHPQLPAEYTMSLVDWFNQLIYQLSLETGSAGLNGGE